MEISTAFGLIGRDIAELGGWFPIGTLVVVMTLALPFAAVAMVRRGFQTAWLSVLVAAVTFGSWFLYYATNLWTNAGQGAWVAIAGATLVGWVILGAALLSRRPARNTDAELTASAS